MKPNCSWRIFWRVENISEIFIAWMATPQIQFQYLRIFRKCRNLEHRNPRVEGSRRSEGSTWEDVDWVFPQLLFAGCFRLLLHEKCSTESFVPVSVSVCVCASMCLCSWGGGGLSTPTPLLIHHPPRGGDVETSEKQGAAKLFYANLLCSFFLFATLIFVYFRLRTTLAEREKKGKWGREKLGKSQPPRKRKWRHKQAASSRRKISWHGKFPWTVFFSLFLAISFCFRSL